MYGEAIVAKQQLEAVGITVDLRVIDWATVLENRAKPEEWDMFGDRPWVRARSEPDLLRRPDEQSIPAGGARRAAWSWPRSCSPSPNSIPAMPIWEKIQEAHYTEIPAIKIGDSSNVSSAPTRSAAGIPSSSAV